VRWSGQLIEEDERGRLPGRIGEGVVRTFDAPEALDTRFYEVRAKSALNRVPRASRMPFEWTVNPYRGCTHACTYCADGETPILMADGRIRRLADVGPGDRIYGTVEGGGTRRYAVTEVLDHWPTVKPVYRVRLANGTELFTSGDHRFLSESGWQYVAGVPGDGYGRRRRRGSRGTRPHLTLDSSLMGTGRFAAPPGESIDYRRGYLCGLVGYTARVPGEAMSGPLGSGLTALAFGDRLGDSSGSVASVEGLAGSPGQVACREELASEGLAGSELAIASPQGLADSPLAVAPRGRSSRWAIPPEALDRVHVYLRETRDLLEGAAACPTRPTTEWCAGFLAGLFDAGGVCDERGVRLDGAEAAMIEATFALDRLAFRFTVDRARDAWSLRLTGGVATDLRFLQAVDPAATARRSIEGRPVETSDGLAVTAIEAMGHSATLFDITTGTGDFVADGVVSHNCFARPTHEYLDLGPGRDFEREIVVKVNVPEVLRAELARQSWGRQHVAMGTNTDPYQWVEGRYQLMRGIWEALRDAANPCSILTKSPLVLRDVDLLQQIAERTEVTACLSVPTLDEKAWRASEPRTPNPRARLEAVAELNRAGIPTGILIAPLMPGINDAPEQVEEIIAIATEAGAAHIGGITLHLRGSVRKVFFDWLRGYRPDLVPRYERLYARGAYVSEPERRQIEHAAGLPRARLESYAERFKHRQAMRRAAGTEPPAKTEQRASQPSLF
jgi:DNA repair photolyase